MKTANVIEAISQSLTDVAGSGCVAVGVDALDQAVSSLLDSFIIRDGFGTETGIPQNFIGKCILAYRLGLLPVELMPDLTKIDSIKSAMREAGEAGFNAPAVSQLCRQLTMTSGQGMIKQSYGKHATPARLPFEGAVLHLAAQIMYYTKATQRREPPALGYTSLDAILASIEGDE